LSALLTTVRTQLARIRRLAVFNKLIATPFLFDPSVPCGNLRDHR
jgi:hypothetical protein